MMAQKETIRSLNDELRRDLTRGAAFMTPGVAALGPDLAERIFDAITLYDDFCKDSDPYGEHDFGSLQVEDHTIFFKIDYFSKDMAMGSPDPSDPSLTKRIITIMLAEEY
ncbi:DUF3768 domain-containing protein [Bradyrhizobium sp. Pear77]|uniref:DUF3768 domain-containing protein n=1 Tax=Bradyrhizobium altum TaxID=1571202 RepID=UPI001E3B57C3|nr:DUF3768 domain-containing protein [Bradyrhizobium altum]MCC8957736.1 DUF3768 domain-containing protein [Bradyrhizobium altum]